MKSQPSTVVVSSNSINVLTQIFLSSEVTSDFRKENLVLFSNLINKQNIMYCHSVHQNVGDKNIFPKSVTL